MKLVNRYFTLGVALAILSLAVFGSNGFLRSVFAGNFFSRLPRELRLGHEIGLIEAEQCNKRTLRRHISTANFAEKLTHVLSMLGAPSIEKMEDLKNTGIIMGRNSRTTTRGATLETLARAAIYLSNKNVITLGTNKVVNYRDFKIPQKYSQAVAYLQGKFVVKGYPNGSFGRNRKIRLQEAIFFLYRFYEAVSADRMEKIPSKNLCFIDIPLDHTVMDSIKNLTKAGAFDKIILKASFDGESILTTSDLSEMLAGIFERKKYPIDQIRMKSIIPSDESYCKRKYLVMVLEYILDTFAKNKLIAKRPYYKDVSIEQPEYEALVKLAGCGITLGYINGKFAGDEYISRFEAVTILNEVMKFAAIKKPVEKKLSRLAQKSDIEDLIALIRAKKDKVHQILTSRDRK